MKTMTVGYAAGLFLAMVAPAAAAPLSAAPSLPWVLAQQDPGDDQGDASALVLRLGRMEEQVRTLTGQIEQLQFQNRKLEENLRKLQADTDFRFQDLEHGGAAAPPRPAAAPPAHRSDAEGTAPLDAGAATASATPSSPPQGDTPVRQRGDAFDPAANPAAAGAPRPLGTTPPSAPLANRTRVAGDAGNAPLDLMGGRAAVATPEAADAPAVIAAPPGAPRDSTSVASLAPGGTRDEYDANLGLYQQGQYDGAASGFAAFADKYPKDRLVPDAIYLAGESYARLGRHREAAEQFLKVSTDYGKSARAPEALLHLGMSLNALGAKEQACATYQEVTRRFATASADVRAGVDRELKRARCQASG